MKKLNPRVLGIDCSWYMQRCFHVLKFRKTFKAMETVIPRMLLSMVLKDAKDLSATHVVICVDAPRSFRYDVYRRYKGNRKEVTLEKLLAPGLLKQVDPSVLALGPYTYLPQTLKLFDACGFSVVEIDRMESDDVMAALGVGLNGKAEVYLATADKDLMAVVGGSCYLYWPKQGSRDTTIVDKHVVFKTKGVKPKQIRDFLCLTGDSVDNIPGIPRVAGKTACKILTEYGSIAEALRDRDSKYGKLLRDNINRLRLARSLVELRTDCWQPRLKDISLRDVNTAVVTKLIGSVPDSLYEFHSYAQVSSRPGLFK